MGRGGARAHVRVDRTVVARRQPHGMPDAGLFETLPTTLFLVDGGNLLWRAAHSHPAPFAANDGRDLTPLFRFFVKLRRALGTYGLFAECVVCFDGADAWSERLAIDNGYKSNRNYEGSDLSFMGWLPEIRAALDAVGIANLEIVDREADDVIATLTARADGRRVRVMSTDRDHYQLISAGTAVVDPRSRPSLVDEDLLFARFGVKAGQWCDFRALSGDPSDGITGLSGVGKVRAAALLADGATLDDLLKRRMSPIAERWDDLSRWRELIRLRTDVDIDFTPTAKPTAKLPPASALCADLGLVG